MREEEKGRREREKRRRGEQGRKGEEEKVRGGVVVYKAIFPTEFPLVIPSEIN
jgi:hypothetical protein